MDGGEGEDADQEEDGEADNEEQGEEAVVDDVEDGDLHCRKGKVREDYLIGQCLFVCLY